MPEQISVTVEGLDGLVAPRVNLNFKPQTAEEFEAIIEACGGPARFSDLSNFAYAEIDRATVYVYEPIDAKPEPKPKSRFMHDFADRIKAARVAGTEFSAV